MLNGQALAAFGPPFGQDFAAGSRLHPASETVGTGSLPLLGVISE